MSHCFGILLLSALSSFGGKGTAAAGPSQRLRDEDVKKLMEDAKKDVERFGDAVDAQFRKATIRSATSEVSIETYLEDLKKSSELMRDRFKEDYAAAREVQSFLRQASAIEKRSSAGGGLFGAEKEWPRLRGTLSRLSQVYVIDWSSSPDGWVARRMNDRELQKAIEAYAASSKSFKKSLEAALDHVGSIGKEERKSVLSAVDRLGDTANDLKDAANDGKDPSGELGLLKAATNEIQSFLEKNGLTNAVGSSFRTLGKDLETINLALS